VRARANTLNAPDLYNFQSLESIRDQGTSGITSEVTRFASIHSPTKPSLYILSDDSRKKSDTQPLKIPNTND